MKVGDEVYLREDSEWNDGSINNPIGTKGRVIDFDENENLPISVDWGFGSNSYKSLDLIIASEHGIPAMNQGHPNASILMEIAKEAAVNPDYLKEFEVKASNNTWYDLFGAIGEINQVLDMTIRRKPRTIRIGSYDVTEPSDVWAHVAYDNVVCVKFVEQDGAELMLKALQELLGAKK